MNLLTFNPSDVDPFGMLNVGGRQAQHMLEVHKVQPGSKLRVGALGGGMGTATVISVNLDSVCLQVGALELPALPPVTDLILALPRPQTLKKVLQLAGSLGLRRLFLIGSDRVERSYFSSPVLTPTHIEEHLRLGLEQGVSTMLPEVSIHPRFIRFLAHDFYQTAEQARFLIADPEAANSLSHLATREPIRTIDSVVLAVGPEGGWRERELALFNERGFQAFSLGQSVLRVEFAVAFLLGQVALLRNLSSQTEAS